MDETRKSEASVQLLSRSLFVLASNVELWQQLFRDLLLSFENYLDLGKVLMKWKNHAEMDFILIDVISSIRGQLILYLRYLIELFAINSLPEIKI